jgi:hypothetical protein
MLQQARGDDQVVTTALNVLCERQRTRAIQGQFQAVLIAGPQGAVFQQQQAETEI